MISCTPLWREANFQVKMHKTDCELSAARYFAQFKIHNLGPLLEVEMSKKCTPLWREAHLEDQKC